MASNDLLKEIASVKQYKLNFTPSERRKGESARDYRKRIGKCVRCGVADADRSKIHCTDCIKRAGEYYRQHKDKATVFQRRSDGLCSDCAMPSATWRCLKCSSVICKRRVEKVAKGYCGTCKKRKSEKGKKRCGICAKRTSLVARNQYKQRKSDGLCVECGKVLDRPLSHNCSECASKRFLIRQAIRQIVIDGYGGKCTCCGEARREFLTLDHVHNDGADERREVKSGGNARLFRRIIANKFPPTYTILCFNCNCAKGIYGICPHQLRE